MNDSNLNNTYGYLSPASSILKSRNDNYPKTSSGGVWSLYSCAIYMDKITIEIVSKNIFFLLSTFLISTLTC